MYSTFSIHVSIYIHFSNVVGIVGNLCIFRLWSIMKPLPLNPKEKVSHHIDAIFGSSISDVLTDNFEFEYSRRTGRI